MTEKRHTLSLGSLSETCSTLSTRSKPPFARLHGFPLAQVKTFNFILFSRKAHETRNKRRLSIFLVQSCTCQVLFFCFLQPTRVCLLAAPKSFCLFFLTSNVKYLFSLVALVLLWFLRHDRMTRSNLICKFFLSSLFPS
jgi:hypothetical protein